MKMNDISRRSFFVGATAANAILASARPTPSAVSTGKPAVLGGTPLRTPGLPSWPVHGPEEEREILNVVRQGPWFRGGTGEPTSAVKSFEKAWAELFGAKYCLATSSCTGALLTSLGALDVGPGDEVILPPYTFVATVNVILMRHALPVFVDSDLDTALIDASKIEPAITNRTAAMIPVHIGGSVADMDAIMAISRKRKVPVIEDAAQAWIAEWRGRKVGTYGATGCFSFQASKNVTCGEGGAILTNDAELYDRCHSFHWNGRSSKSGDVVSYGTKFCMTAFQAAVLLAQMTRLEAQQRTREKNAAYLTSMLREIPGIIPYKMYPGCTRNGYHEYGFRYQSEHFAGLPMQKFLTAVAAEGIPVGGGYSPLNQAKYLKETLRSKSYRRIYSEAELAGWDERNRCPVNEQLCRESVSIYQSFFLTGRSDMEQTAEAIRKAQKYAAEIARV